uniref:glycosyl hydrolase family 32 n=1 Tax=Prosthecobacter sp. TaxID=1965333 RepID=UPI003783105A
MKRLIQFLLLSGFVHGGETLPNGIVLPVEWPPRIGGDAGKPPLETFSKPGDPPEPPYLKTKPAVIEIDLGRQLFVDDFLISEMTLKRVWHQPVKFADNPVLKPEKPWELGTTRTPMAAPFSDGCFYDPMTKRFMLWYSSGWYDSTALAVSRDGLQWERPEYDVFPGTNKVMLKVNDDWRRDTVSIWLDHDAARPDERFKATMFCRSGALGTKLDNYHPGLLLLASPDGIHWTLRGQTKHSKDNTTMFYNPFRKVWVFSHRIHIKHDDGRYERARAYWETKDFFSVAGEAMKERTPVYWMSEQASDLRETTKQGSAAIELGNSTLAQIYKIDATPYESLMLGLFEILSGPTNDECAAEGKPKRTDLQVAFSRDGFHWSRHRETFIGGTGKSGSWDRGYISSVGGGCLIVGDELLFPYGAFAGDPSNTEKYYVWGGLYANGATGIAKLRRDGFASMRGPGTLTTEPVRFSGKHLFVNAKGSLRTEVLDADGKPIVGLTAAECTAFNGDSTRARVSWKGNLASQAGKPVRFRFHLAEGDLYAFWITSDERGSSGGYVAGGGPDFDGGRDQKRTRP